MKTEQKNVTRLGILHAITFGRDLFNSIATEGDPDEYPTGLKIMYNCNRNGIKIMCIN
jgi:hypothetical protein